MNIRFLILFLCIWAMPSLAQPMVIRIDTTISKNQNKSLPRAMLASAALPGLGQLYLGEKKRSDLFILADAVIWTSALISYTLGEVYLYSAAGHARTYAQANPPVQVDFLETMGAYQSRGGMAGTNHTPAHDEDYNQTMIRQGLAVDHEYPDTEKYRWDWGSSDNPQNTAHREEYLGMLRNYRRSRIFLQSSVGALLLNRLLSTVDVIQIYKATASKSFSGRFVPFTSGNGAGTAFYLSF
jgi:hypothetical protein